MNNLANSNLIYYDHPVFGVDIGFSSIKVMQIEPKGKKPKVKGYGAKKFDSDIIKDGVISDYKALAKTTQELFQKDIIGKIDTKRVIATIPAAKAYSRVISQPSSLTKKELDEAVLLEAAQYIPIPLEELYLDYSIVGKDNDIVDIMVVGAPKNIVDSYINFFNVIGLDLCAIETTTSAASRIISFSDNSSDIPTILIDLGSLSVDLTVYDKNLVINGTIPGGGDDFSEQIANILKLNKAEADNIKTKFGLGVSKYQHEIREALKPQIDSLIKEIRRVCRYYEEKTNGKSTIGQVITMGGGSNMPGLVDYLTDNLRIPTRLCSFWNSLDHSSVAMPEEAQKIIYATVAGAAILRPEEIK